MPPMSFAANMTLSERATDQLRRLTARHGMKARLAKELNTVPSAITPYINGERDVTLRMLEALCAITGTPVAELVCAPDSLVRELNPEEAIVLRWLRSWPKDVSRNLLLFMRFFADEPPVLARQRAFHELYRELPEPDRDWLHGVAAQLRERSVPPDLRAGIEQRLRDEAKPSPKRQAQRRKSVQRKVR